MTPNTSPSRIYNLDIIKAVAIIFVMFIHLKPIQLHVPIKTNIDTFSQTLLTMSDIFYNQIVNTAVPLFMLVALYLFCGKIALDPSYFKKRMLRLTAIFLFWTAVQFLIRYILAILAYLNITDVTLLDVSMFKALVHGGPPLPIIGDSVFYFLFNLIWLHIFMFLYVTKIPDKNKKTVSLALMVCLPIYVQLMNYYYYMAYWRLDNFIVYVPAAYLLKYSKNFLKLKYYYLLGFILFSIHDLILRDTAPYSRIAIFLGALTILCFIFSRKPGKESAYIKFLSQYSLGIYALHTYWNLFLRLSINEPLLFLMQHKNIPFFNLELYSMCLIQGIISILMTIISAYLLGFTPLKTFIS